MQLVYKFNIPNDPKLIELFKYSKNLYNQVNYLIKQELGKNGKFVRYNELDKILKYSPEEFDNYKKLKIQTSGLMFRPIKIQNLFLINNFNL